MKKTNAARYLDRLQLDYKLVEYDVDEFDLSAESVAKKVNLPPGQVFKTLVARGDKTGVLLACVPAGTELDLKVLALISGNKKVEMVPVKEIESLTGYVRGGVSPLGTKRRYPFYLSPSAQESGAASSLSIPGVCQRYWKQPLAGSAGHPDDR